jgi:hypothetical protein
MGVEIFFLGLPGWFIAVLIYLGLSKLQQDRYQKKAKVETAQAKA